MVGMTFDEWLFTLGLTALAVISLLMFTAACRRENTRINEGIEWAFSDRDTA